MALSIPHDHDRRVGLVLAVNVLDVKACTKNQEGPEGQGGADGQGEGAREVIETQARRWSSTH